MERKHFFILLFITFLLGAGFSVLNYFYPFEYLYRTYIRKEFTINPKAKILTDKKYNIKIWYNPFYRTIEELKGKETIFFDNLEKKVKEKYPNINLEYKEINFLESEKKINEAIQNTAPPDIYLNFSNDSLINKKYQIPIENYLTPEEKNNFNQFRINEHIWAWPFLIQPQIWMANTENKDIKKDNDDFLNKISTFKQTKLALNYRDYTLLRQLLSLNGVNQLSMNKDTLSEENMNKIEEIFVYLHNLRKKEAFGNILLERMDDNFVKQFFEDSQVVIGPLNPWLEKLLKSRNSEYVSLRLNDLFKVFTLCVFYQKPFPGDDHVKAVMEVARIATKNHSENLASNLDLQPGYIQKDQVGTKLLELTPSTKKVWKEKIIPAWLDFWKKGLTPEEVINNITTINNEK